jgi:3-dehydroquinate dehydratase/shikimate dehydrogenase
VTFIAVPILVRRADMVPRALEEAKEAASRGANLIEWRIDLLIEEPDAEAAVVRLVRECPLPCIVTARRVDEGGSFAGMEVTRSVVIDAAAKAGHPPRYVDVELESFRTHHRLWRPALMKESSLILSGHDFTGRPRDLLQQIEAMVNEPACAVIKVAWMARSLRDNLEAFDVLAERKKPMIALCMGRFGLMSRVLAPKFGGLLTFASLEKGDESAPGQPTIEELKSLYRFDAIGRETRVYGVIGWPVEHSQSPRIHNAAFDETGFDGVYLPMPIPPEWEHFKATIGAIIDHPRLGFRGASVTIPHKEHLLRFVEERGGRVDDFARLAGAANTLIVGSAGGLVCANTDAPAIVRALGRDDVLKGTRVAILGAGGVARAAIAGLMMHDADITIFNRTGERAAGAVREFSEKRRTIESRSEIRTGEVEMLAREKFDICINCTSVGMEGGSASNQTPFETLGVTELRLDETTTVLDTVYAPRETPMLREAAARGARAISGVEVFLHQAALQFEMWTGKKANVRDLGFDRRS